MTFIKTMHLTIGEAKELEHRGFILKFVGFTSGGPMYEVHADASEGIYPVPNQSIDDATPEEWEVEHQRWLRGDYDDEA